MTERKKKGSETSYADASRELEAILQEIESGEVDLDVLSEKVERAAALIALCRGRLAATELKVQRAVAELAAEAEGTAPAAEVDEVEETDDNGAESED